MTALVPYWSAGTALMWKSSASDLHPLSHPAEWRSPFTGGNCVAWTWLRDLGQRDRGHCLHECHNRWYITVSGLNLWYCKFRFWIKVGIYFCLLPSLADNHIYCWYFVPLTFLMPHYNTRCMQVWRQTNIKALKRYSIIWCFDCCDVMCDYVIVRSLKHV